MKRWGLVPLLLAGPAVAQDAWLPKGTADLVLLDKVRAQPSNVSLKVGDSIVFGSITVHVASCFVRPPDQPADSTAFVDVTDTRNAGKPGTGADVFHGWLLSQTPSLSAIEHPVYDVRLMGCH